MSIDEEDLERRVDFLIRELDEFCALATKHETTDLMVRQRIALGQMQTRLQLILSFVELRVKYGKAFKRDHGIHVVAQDRQR